jgi:hypothetical protein
MPAWFRHPTRGPGGRTAPTQVDREIAVALECVKTACRFPWKPRAASLRIGIGPVLVKACADWAIKLAGELSGRGPAVLAIR